MKKVTVQVPATSANLGPGFDVLGVALGLYNDVSMASDQGFQSRPYTALAVRISGDGVDTLPIDKNNLIVRAAEVVFKEAGRWPKRLSVEVMNRIPLARGMGSSSAAIVGGMAAANKLIGSPLSLETIVDLAVAMEGHPDNVVPAALGGFCVSGLFDGKPRWWRLSAPKGLKAIVCVPDLQLSTQDAREALPKKVKLQDAVFTASRTAFLIGAVVRKRYADLGEAMADVLHQPYRAKLVPGLLEAIAGARKAGAYGAALSGAGSCVIALAPVSASSSKIGNAMKNVFKQQKIASQWLDLTLEEKGIRTV